MQRVDIPPTHGKREIDPPLLLFRGVESLYLSNWQEQDDEVCDDVADGGDKLQNPVLHAMAFDRIIPIGFNRDALTDGADGAQQRPQGCEGS